MFSYCSYELYFPWGKIKKSSSWRDNSLFPPSLSKVERIIAQSLFGQLRLQGKFRIRKAKSIIFGSVSENMDPPALNIRKTPFIQWWGRMIQDPAFRKMALTVLIFLSWIHCFHVWLSLEKKKKWSPWDGEVGRVGEWWGNGMGCEYHKNKSGHNYFPGILESSSTYHQFWNSGQKHLTPDSHLFPLKKVNSHFSDSLWFISVEKGRMWCQTKTLFPETALWNLNKQKTQLIHFPSVTLKLK